MTDFELWLQRHSDHFTTYSYEEIADVAIAAGFPRAEVSKWYERRKSKENA